MAGGRRALAAPAASAATSPAAPAVPAALVDDNGAVHRRMDVALEVVLAGVERVDGRVLDGIRATEDLAPEQRIGELLRARVDRDVVLIRVLVVELDRERLPGGDLDATGVELDPTGGDVDDAVDGLRAVPFGLGLRGRRLDGRLGTRFGEREALDLAVASNQDILVLGVVPGEG